MASVILGTILLSVLVIIVADVPNSVSSTGQAGNLDAAALPECQWNQWRLPLNVTPEQYSLRMQAQLDDPFTVTGYVEIAVKISQPTLCVVLGAAAMTITNASLLTPNLAGKPCLPKLLTCSNCSSSMACAGVHNSMQAQDLAQGCFSSPQQRQMLQRSVMPFS